MAKKLPISKKLAKRKYKPAPKFIAWVYKTIMVDIIGRKYKPNFHIIDMSKGGLNNGNNKSTRFIWRFYDRNSY